MNKKNMDYYDAQKIYGLKPFGDIDKDGVKNIWDCKPYDISRDGLFGRFVNVISGGRYGQSREEYAVEKENKYGHRENRFTRESHTEFERDEEGTVTSVTRSGDKPKRGLFESRTPISDKLEKEYYKEHPEKKLSSRLVSAGKSFDKRVVSKMQPIDMRSPPSKKSVRMRYSMRNNYNPFGNLFDSGMSYSGPNWNQPFPHAPIGPINFSSGKHSKGNQSKGKHVGQKYVVVGGKAYPVADKGKKKVKKHSRRVSAGFDAFDNFGFMKKGRK